MTRKELVRRLNKIELALLSARDLTDVAHVRELRKLLFQPQEREDLRDASLSDQDLDALAIAVEAKLP